MNVKPIGILMRAENFESFVQSENKLSVSIIRS